MPASTPKSAEVHAARRSPPVIVKVAAVVFVVLTSIVTVQALRNLTNVEGIYATTAGTPRLLLNRDGTGSFGATKTQTGTTRSDFDQDAPILYTIRGTRFHIDAVDPATGKAFSHGGANESAAAKMMSGGLSDGYISPSRTTIQVMGTAFYKQ